MVGIVDVARLANVSTATVSRVISKSPTVKKETANKVLEAINQLNYQPNMLARQLRRSETNTILVVVPDISNPFFSNILRGIESVATENGYQVILADTENSVEKENSLFTILRHKRADGIILLTARSNHKILEEIANDFPTVLACEYIEGSSIPTVSIDNISSARKATEYLISLNHQRIGHISGPLNVVIGRDRLRGYKQAMSQYGLEIDSLLVQEGDFSYESGFNLMRKFLSLENPPTAIFVANDEMAIGAIKAVKSRGLRVPEDFSIIGFDNIKYSSIIEPSLTTISQPTFDMGNKAMELLLNLINGSSLEKEQYMLSDQLIIRESCQKKD